MHLIQGDVAALLDDAVELDFLPEDVDKTALYPVLERVFAGARLAAKRADAAAPVAKRRKEFAAVAGDLNDVFFTFPFSVPEYFALITRALIVLEGIALTGDPNFDIFKAAYPHGLRRAKEVFGAEGLARIAAAAAGEMATRRREARRHDDRRLRTRATM